MKAKKPAYYQSYCVDYNHILHSDKDQQTHFVGGLGEYPDFHCTSGFFLCLFWSLRHAHRSHRWNDFQDLYVIRRFSTQGCVFWGLFVITPHLGAEISQKPEYCVHCESEKGCHLTMAMTLSVLGGFAKFFHCCKEQ